MATALITGASQGIGACIAKRLAKDGYNVAINHFPSDSDKANAEKVAEECRSFGVEAELFAANVADYAQCEAMTKAVKERFGSIDALVNNAGITKDGLMARMSEEQYDAVIAVNQKSVFNMMKLVGTVMMRQRHGRIVSLASVAGLYGNPGQINYSASKGCHHRHDQDCSKGTGRKKRHRKRCGTGLYQDTHDRRPHRRTAQQDAGAGGNEALRRAGRGCKRDLLPLLG